MPPLIIGVALLAVGVPLASTYIIGIGLSLVLSGVSSLFSQKKPKAPVFTQEASSRSVTARQPIAPWRVTYGRGGFLGGILTFIGTSGTTNEFINLVITLNGHSISAIDTVRFDGVTVPLDGSGNATGTFAGFVHVEKNLGTSGQAAFAGLITELPTKWTASHRQRGRAGAYVRLKWNADLFPNGVPNITFDLHGHNLVFDPRGPSTGYSENPALCLREFLTNAIYGLGATSAEIDDASFIAAANVCDEAVALSAGGTESRYTCNGSFETSQKPADTIRQLLTSMAGYLVYTAGKWSVYAGAWRAPTISLGDNDARDALKVQARLSKRETCNRVKGVYINPTNNWKPSDFPAYYQSTNRGFSSDAYLAQDGGERLERDIELPFTISAATAQRLAKIELERTRRQITLQFPARLTGYQLVPPDVVQITHSRFSWTTKTFEVQQAKLEQYEDDQSQPTMGVALFLRESDSTIFSWGVAEDLGANALPALSLPDMGAVSALAGLTVTSGGVNALLGKEGKILTSIFITWTAPSNEFVLSGGVVESQYKKTADSIWLPLPDIPGSQTKVEIKTAEHGVGYDVRIRARNSIGTRGAYSTASHTADHGVAAPGTPTISTSAMPIAGGVQIKFEIAGLVSPHIERYNIYRNTTNNSGTATLTDFVSNSISDTAFTVTWQDSTLINNVEYFYWIEVVNIAKVAGTKTSAGSAIPNFSVPAETINLFANPATQGSGNLPAFGNPIVAEEWQRSGGGTPEYRNNREIRIPATSGTEAGQFKSIARFKPGQIVTFSVRVRRGGLVGSPTGNFRVAVQTIDNLTSGITTQAATIAVSDLLVPSHTLYRVTVPMNKVGGQSHWLFTVFNDSTQDDIYITEPMLNPGSDAALFTTNTFLTDVSQYAFEGESFVSDDFFDSNATALTSHRMSAGGVANAGKGQLYAQTLEAGTTVAQIQSNKAEFQIVGAAGSAQNAIYRNQEPPQSVAYAAQADCNAGASTGAAMSAGVMVRVKSDTTDAYLGQINTSNTVELFKRVASTYTSLGTYAHSGPSATLKLQVSDATKKVFVDGTERISSSDNAVTATNFAGMRFAAANPTTVSTKPTIDNYSAFYIQNVTAPPAPPAPANVPAPPPPIDYDPDHEPGKRRTA